MGIIVAIVAVTTETAAIISAFSHPKSMTEIFIKSVSSNSLFNTGHIIAVTAMDSIRHVSATISASAQNIMNTSALLAPIARRIPISFFFAEMEAEMNANISSIANAVKPSHNPREIFFNNDTVEFTANTLSIIPLLMEKEELSAALS